jgi:DNA-binding transcriptional LysR family regulator
MPKEALPTRAGEILYGYAKKLLALREEAETALAEFQGTIKGRLMVGGSTIPGVYILPRTIGLYTRKHQEVKISLMMGDTGSIIDRILSGDLELGVVGALSEDGGIEQELLLEDEMRLIVPASHRWAGKSQVTLDNLQKEPFIIRESGSGTLKSIQRSFEQRGRSIRKLNVSAEMGSTEAVVQAIKAEAGVSILSTLAVSEDVHAGRLRALKIRGLDLCQRFYTTRLKKRTPSPLCKSFLDFLMSNMTQQAADSDAASSNPAG